MTFSTWLSSILKILGRGTLISIDSLTTGCQDACTKLPYVVPLVPEQGRAYRESSPLPSFVKAAENCSEDAMGHEDGQGRGNPIVKAHESGRLEHWCCAGTVGFTGHTRVNAGQYLKSHQADQKR